MFPHPTTANTENTTIHTTCFSCKEKKDIVVRSVDFVHWKKGKLIRQAFPYLNAGDRELLISGTCGDCFDNMFRRFPN